MFSKILVALQFLFIFLMTLPFGSPTQNLMLGLIVSGLGGVVGLLAIMQHKRGNFNIRPDIKEGCVLVQEGIYKYIRHPMYLSVLLMTLGIVLVYPMVYEYVLYGALVLTLLVKLLYEEHLWQCHNTQAYREYMSKTKRLIPFIF